MYGCVRVCERECERVWQARMIAVGCFFLSCAIHPLSIGDSHGHERKHGAHHIAVLLCDPCVSLCV